MVNNIMEEIIKIKCPFCGAVLNAKNQPGIETKTVKCVKCKQINKFTNFKRLQPVVSGAPTKRPIQPEELTTEKTLYGPMEHRTEESPLGIVRLLGRNITYQLKAGKNTIGRKCSSSDADFQIDTGSSRLMSRQHLQIEAVKKGAKGYVHYASLCRDNINTTAINGEPLLYKVDQIILNPGDMINLPDAELRFEIPDEEATEIL